jgi:hypothetical protein
MKHYVLARVAILPLVVALTLPAARAESLIPGDVDPYAGIPTRCERFMHDVRAGRIVPELEMERAHPVLNGAAGATLALGGGAFASSFLYAGVVLGGKSLLASAAGVLAYPPALLALGAAAGGTYLLKRSWNDRQKIDCMRIAQGMRINASVRDARDLTSVSSSPIKQLPASAAPAAPGSTVSPRSTPAR